MVPGDNRASLLVKKIRHQHEPSMPYQDKQLSKEEIADIVTWVGTGAPYSGPLKTSAEDLQNQERQGPELLGYHDDSNGRTR